MRLQPSFRLWVGLVLATAPVCADLTAQGLSRSGPLGQGDVRSGATSWEIEQLRRELPPGTSTERGRIEWELQELRRDADRAAPKRAEELAGNRGGAGLLGADRETSPVQRGLVEADRVYGTGKAWIRLGDLLSGAEERLRLGDRAAASGMADDARARLDALRASLPPRVALEDAQVRATAARLARIDAQLSSAAAR